MPEPPSNETNMMLFANQAQMDDLGSGMTDSKPLINIKSALQRVKTEIKQMDIRTGVLEHSLLNVRLKNKAAMFHATNMGGNINNPSIRGDSRDVCTL
jgi:hypothetical protein